MYLVVFAKRAAADKKLLKRSHLDKKAKELLELLASSPRSSPPPYEALLGDLAGRYSRRINRQHRLVYSIIEGVVERDGIVFDGVVKVLRMWSHYGE